MTENQVNATTETQDKIVEQQEEEPKQNNTRTKALIAFVLLALIGFVVYDSLTNKHIGAAISTFLEWIEDNPALGFFAFMLVYFVATILFVPGSLLTLGAGFVFANVFGLGTGVLLGAMSVFFGASSGAIAAFLLGRFLLRDWVVQGLTQKYSLFYALDAAFEEKGFRIMSLLRLSPIIPFNALNYIAGVTAISLWNYVWSCFAILPGTILYVFLGASAGSLSDSANSGSDSTVTLIVIIVGIVFGILAVGVTSYYAKQELNKVVAKREAEQKEAAKEQRDPENPERLVEDQKE
jgi:uncharacterized membrane protein YdjX (TVP38/TMEM64 family)